MGLVKNWRHRTHQDWLIDGIGLLFQGWGVPILATLLANNVLPYLMSRTFIIISVPSWVLFLLPFTLVDYLYYWNHRLLHTRKFWNFHRVHHSSEQLDIFVTSRNSFWTPFFLIYIWFHAMVIFFTHDTQAYVYGLWLMSTLDFWRHSGLTTPKSLKFLNIILILPEEHEWHHSSDQFDMNFGGNLNLWDRLHGTYFKSNERATKLGSQVRGTLWQELFFPWKIDQRVDS